MSGEGFKLGWDSRIKCVVHIDQVPEGFEHAVCPDCGSPLIAANRKPDTRIKTTYFRHRNESNCSGETLIHLWAKQVIAEKLSVRGAEYIAVGNAKDLMRKFHRVELRQEPENIDIQACDLEKSLSLNNHYRVPDVSAILPTAENLYIEIFVHSAVDEPRSDFYESNKLNCLEIDLSELPPEYLSSPQLFERYVIAEAPRKWIFCSLYTALDQQAQTEAEDKAKAETDETNKRRDRKRSAKTEWREEHSDFISLVDAYLKPENQDKANSYYDYQLSTPGSPSFNTRQLLESKFRSVPEVVNISVKGELGFHCHRIVWQWEVYRRLVINGYHRATKAAKSVKTTWSTRGYEKDMALLAWYDYAPKWSAERLYSEILGTGITVRPICSEAEKIVGEPIIVERDRPEELQYLKVNEWRGMPKPVCVIRRYLRELVSREIIETFGNDYIVKQGAKPPLCF